MKNKNGNKLQLLYLGMIVILALCPPLGVVLVLCAVFCDGTLSGFLGCLTPLIILIVLALVMMAFT